VYPDLAERHLYATITIRDCFESSHTSPQAFEDPEGYILNSTALDFLISKNSRILEYARTLHINLPLHGNRKTSFAKLTKLESLTLSHRVFPYHDCWPALDNDFKSAFLASLRSPCLKEVCILSVADFPLSTLLGCKPLKKLTIQAWDVETGTNSHVQNESVSVSESYPRLESLKLIHNTKVFDTLISRANLANLSRLFLTMTFNREGDSILRLLRACYASLKNLQVYFPSSRKFSRRYFPCYSHTYLNLSRCQGAQLAFPGHPSAKPQ
jgi:hypothetical protein